MVCGRSTCSGGCSTLSCTDCRAVCIVWHSICYIVFVYQNSRTKTNINSIIGEEAKVTEEIDNFNQKGAVVVRGLEWTARSADEKEIIPEGSKVRVKEIKGVKLIVEKEIW